MPHDPFVTSICQNLIAEYGVHTIILYGSHADGSAGPDSDYDITAFCPIEHTVQETRVIDGAFVDAFIYPEAVLKNPLEKYLRFRGGLVICQRGSEASIAALANVVLSEERSR